MSLVELREITRTVELPDGSDLRILRGVNLTVEAGEKVSIVGRSGTGKSTLLNIVGMLDKPTSGEYSIDGRSAISLREAARAKMRGDTFGFVFQQFNIFNARTALENVEVPLLYATGKAFWTRKSRAAAFLDRVGLGDRLDSYPTQMSGGEQQRIAIARALVREPKIILADEPTGALDPDTGKEVMGLLEEVAKENNAALITITHDMNVAVRADRVFTLGEGVLHHVENPHDVLLAAGEAIDTAEQTLDDADPAAAETHPIEVRPAATQSAGTPGSGPSDERAFAPSSINVGTGRHAAGPAEAQPAETDILPYPHFEEGR